MTPDLIQLGPFDIFESADRGGMAEVWRGVHRTQRVPIALKVLTGPDASHPNFLQAFRNEVVAVAGLDHPHIIHLYDHGVIDADIERRSEGRLAAGCPYFVMEWASAGNLAIGARPRTWRELRAALFALLDALGHAHARGVIHRDLKRQNVLMCGANDLRPGWKLADFGMARPPGVEADPLAGGTPGLMSPEQADGRWRDQGPWTDLYALGCLTWVMVSGKRGQALPPPGELLTHRPERTQVGVPSGLWQWIARLTEPNPQDRPQFAAQARAWLESLPDPTPEEDALVDERQLDEPLTNPEPTSGGAQTVVLVALPGPLRTRDRRPSADMRIPIPVDWRVRQVPGDSLRLHGAGLSLWGLRHLPMVGREEERDKLWEALCGVASTGRPRCVILRGAAGTGKSRLARWLCWRAHEVGAASWLCATHEATTGPADGIGPMVARYLRSAGMDREDLAFRLEDLVADGYIQETTDTGPLLELLSPDAGHPFAGADRQHAGREAARRLIAQHAGRTPRIVWIDDAQYDGGSIEFASRLLETHAPVLVLVCVRDEDVVARPEIGHRLVELARHQDVAAIDVAPLQGRAWRSMVREILGLDGALAAQLEERAAGNPLFAVHLVGEWVARGLLVRGETGFRLAPRVQVEFPEDLHAVWRGHLDALLAGRPTPDAFALELAAALGQDVSYAEWRAACDRAGIPMPAGLVEALVTRRLAHHSEPGERWNFVHAMIRESLLRRAREGGRLASHHLLCAAVIAELGASPGTAERRARHLLAGGAIAEALGPLLLAARTRVAAGERDSAAALVTEFGRAIEQAALPPDHPLRAESALLRAALAGLKGDAAEECRAGSDAVQQAGALGDRGLQARALLRWGVGLRERGELAQAITRLQEGGDAAEAAGEAATAGLALAELGRAQLLLGHEDLAFSALALAERRLRQVQHPSGIATALLGLAAACRSQDILPRALGHARNALGYVELSGGRRLLGEVLIELGDIARAHGDLAAAESWYRTASERARLAGNDTLASALGMGLAHIERGQCGTAMVALRDVLDQARSLGRRLVVARARMGIVACAAKAGEWALWDEQLSAALADLRTTGLLDPDIRSLARRAQTLALGAGEALRAARVSPLLNALAA